MSKFILLILALLVVGGEAFAQLSQEEVAIVQNLYGMEKRAIYREVMAMSPMDSVAFWPLYDQFEVKRKDLAKNRIMWMEKLATKYPNISNEEIDEIVEESHEIAEELLELEKDFYDKIKEKASAAVAAKFYQIERFLNTAISLELGSRLPFIGEFSVRDAKK
jgi:ASC-1-like (ASCH) protein